MARELAIHADDQVYVADGGAPLGAVRERPDAHSLVIYIENAGDFRVPIDAIEKAEFGRVVLRPDLLTPELKRAIAHATDREDYPPDEDISLEGPIDEVEVETRVLAPEKHPPR